MKTCYLPASPDERPKRLLVTAKEAAQMLAISERTLWTLTKIGEIPPVHIRRCVRYDVADLRRWIERHKETRRGANS